MAGHAILAPSQFRAREGRRGQDESKSRRSDEAEVIHQRIPNMSVKAPQRALVERDGTGRVAEVTARPVLGGLSWP
jgi:hypothetical protein